ncbi:MAG: TIGR04002 family protein [Lachnospiraceae bacterium]|nr:TIGR04002 family protein [Lachnospiraceae bacterium]
MVFTSKSIYQGYYKIKYMALTGVFAALITIMTAYICHVPIGINGGYVHFGDAFIYLAASLLPLPYALAAAAIGGGLADLLTAPMWAPATILIKMLIVLPFTSKANRIVAKRNVMSTVSAYFISGFGYYIAERLMFENGAVLVVTMAQTAVQSLGSAVVYLLLGAALDRGQFKNRFFEADRR